MNQQECYDITAAHLLKQGKKAVGEVKNPDTPFDTGAIRCRYRVEDIPTGAILSCAIGCHIPDEVYDPSMEGHNVYYLMANPAIEELFAGLSVEFLCELQSIHDSFLPVDWPEMLESFADTYGLVPYRGDQQES